MTALVFLAVVTCIVAGLWTVGAEAVVSARARRRRPYDWVVDGGVRSQPRHLRVLDADEVTGS